MPAPSWTRSLLLLAAVAVASSCNHGKRAVEACEDLAETLECGDADFYTVLNCNGYADIECNITDYFDCLEENFECVDGLVSFGGQCEELGVCE